MLPAKPEGSMNEAGESPQAKLLADLTVVGEGIDKLLTENRELARALGIVIASQSPDVTAWRNGRPGQEGYAVVTRQWCEWLIAKAEGRQP